MFTKIAFIACLLGLAHSSVISSGHVPAAAGLNNGLGFTRALNGGHYANGGLPSLGHSAGLGGVGYGGLAHGAIGHAAGLGYGNGLGHSLHGNALGHAGIGYGGRNAAIGRNLGGPGAYEINVSGVAGHTGGIVSEYQYSISHPPTVNTYGANGGYSHYGNRAIGNGGYAVSGNSVYGHGAFGHVASGNSAYGHGAPGRIAYGVNPAAAGW